MSLKVKWGGGGEGGSFGRHKKRDEIATKETGLVLYQTVKETNFDLVPSKLLNRVPRTAILQLDR